VCLSQHSCIYTSCSNTSVNCPAAGVTTGVSAVTTGVTTVAAGVTTGVTAVSGAVMTVAEGAADLSKVRHNGMLQPQQQQQQQQQRRSVLESDAALLRALLICQRLSR
jgi:hypothetical protein